jgi:hypothetical protein
VRNPWKHEEVLEIDWVASRPNIMAMGGNRSVSAPPLSWYRNPQFSIRLKGDADDVAEHDKKAGEAASRSLSGDRGGDSPAESFEILPAEHVLQDLFSRCDTEGIGQVPRDVLLEACKHSHSFINLLPPTDEEKAKRLKSKHHRRSSLQKHAPEVEALFDDCFDPSDEDILREDFIDLHLRLDPAPLLLATLAPSELRRPGCAPTPPAAAVHLLRNLPEASDVNYPGYYSRPGCLVENPRFTEVLGSSGPAGRAYISQGEIGALGRLPRGESVIVVPSLESKTSTGKYTLKLFCSEKIVVERVN